MTFHTYYRSLEKNEIILALGLNRVQNPLVCGSLKMYEGTKFEVTLPVQLNSQFILGPEGAHLNISGISGLASKTSYAMFLMKAIQERYSSDDSEESVAFVIFNVKGRDLMAIDKPNEFMFDPEGEGRPASSNEISVLSWRKFKRIINKATKNDDMFANLYRCAHW